MQQLIKAENVRKLPTECITSYSHSTSIPLDFSDVGLSSLYLLLGLWHCRVQINIWLDPSSQALMEKLDELLVDCTPKEVAEDSSYYDVDYTVGLEFNAPKPFQIPF